MMHAAYIKLSNKLHNVASSRKAADNPSFDVRILVDFFSISPRK